MIENCMFSVSEPVWFKGTTADPRTRHMHSGCWGSCGPNGQKSILIRPSMVWQVIWRLWPSSLVCRDIVSSSGDAFSFLCLAYVLLFVVVYLDVSERMLAI